MASTRSRSPIEVARILFTAAILFLHLPEFYVTIHHYGYRESMFRVRETYYPGHLGPNSSLFNAPLAMGTIDGAEECYSLRTLYGYGGNQRSKRDLAERYPPGTSLAVLYNPDVMFRGEMFGKTPRVIDEGFLATSAWRTFVVVFIVAVLWAGTLLHRMSARRRRAARSTKGADPRTTLPSKPVVLDLRERSVAGVRVGDTVSRAVSLLGEPNSFRRVRVARTRILSYPGRWLEVETQEDRVTCLTISLDSVTVRLNGPLGQALILTASETVRAIIALLGPPVLEDVDESEGVYTFEGGKWWLQVETSTDGIPKRLILAARR